MNSELLRITSESNTKSAYLSAFGCAAASIGFLSVAFFPEHNDAGVGLVAGIVGVLLIAVFLDILYGLVFPFQSEFVIETHALRHGLVAQRLRQRLVRRSEIKCLILDDGPDESLCMNIGKSLSPPLTPGILSRADLMVEVAKAIRLNWPEVPVYNREEYQNLCRAKLNRTPRT